MAAHFPILTRLLNLILILWSGLWLTAAAAQAEDLEGIIATLSGYGDRSSGSPGSDRAAEYISGYFEQLNLEPHDYYFQVP
ncbi:MAG: hypothetical protein LJE64_11005, partial [Desulfofustis sp.]|nr:hypothetical protein [Desulfofustis sp.]